jgi:hypothetical protein
MGGGLTAGFFQGVDADSTNGAQTIASTFDREGTVLHKLVRGTSGTTNIVVVDSAGVPWFVSVATNGTLSASASVVA